MRDPVGALVMGILSRSKRPCRTAGARRSRKTKRRRKTHEDDGEDDGDDEDEALDSDGDEGDGGGDNSSEDDGEDDDGEEDKGPEEDPVELVKADWEGAHEEMPVELYYDWDTCQYKLVDKHGPFQCSMKNMNKTKSSSVYCRHHGSSMLIGHRCSPPHLAMCVSGR